MELFGIFSQSESLVFPVGCGSGAYGYRTSGISMVHIIFELNYDLLSRLYLSPLSSVELEYV